MKYPLFLLCLFLLAAPAGALAQESAPAGVTAPSSAAQPVNIEADELEFRQEEKLYVARGHAVVEQGGVRIAADRLSAAYTEDSSGKTTFTLVNAEGNVLITSQKGQVSGDRGVYDVAREVAVLKGSQLRLVTPTDEVTARDSLEFWQKEQMAVARGAAVARRADKTISADLLTAQLAETAQHQLELRRVGAEGNVRVATASEVALGNRGLYDVHRELATLEGNVRLTRGLNQLNGARAEVNMATGVSRLLSGRGQRVRGLIVPKDAPEVR